LLPGFLFASATIDNDVLANTLGALLLLIAVWRGGGSYRQGLAFGAISTLALLTKLDLLPLVAIGGLLLAGQALRSRRPATLAYLAIPLLPALAFWLWRIHQGDHNLIGDRVTWPPPLPGSTGPLDWSLPGSFAVDMWHSLFGAFGRQNVFMPGWLYLVYGLVYLGGGFVALRRSPSLPENASPKDHRILLLVWLAIPFLAILGRYFLLTGPRTGYDSSRFLYPAAARARHAHGHRPAPPLSPTGPDSAHCYPPGSLPAPCRPSRSPGWSSLRRIHRPSRSRMRYRPARRRLQAVSSLRTSP